MRLVGHLLLLILALAPGMWPRFVCRCYQGTRCEGCVSAEQETDVPRCPECEAEEPEAKAPAPETPDPCRCPNCPYARAGDETIALPAAVFPAPPADFVLVEDMPLVLAAAPVRAVAHLAHPPGPPRERLGPVVLRI